VSQINLRWGQAVGWVDEISFDVPMREGYSWTGGGDNYLECDGKKTSLIEEAQHRPK
jgi:hypothetical protein